LSGEPVIRPATRDDVVTIHALLEELARVTCLENKLRSRPQDLLEHGFSGPPAFEGLVAERDGELLGMTLFFYTFSTWRGEPGVYVQDIVVTGHARGLGLGRRLMQETARHAAERGATHLRLSIDSDNAAALGFYRNLGLEHSDREQILEADGAAFRRLAADG
jgi:ribosomal protein S18 acetylase RimI-like enzyme